MQITQLWGKMKPFDRARLAVSATEAQCPGQEVFIVKTPGRPFVLAFRHALAGFNTEFSSACLLSDNWEIVKEARETTHYIQGEGAMLIIPQMIVHGCLLPHECFRIKKGSTVTFQHAE